MQVLSRLLPPSSALFSDYQNNWPRVQPFYSREYSLDAIAAFARQRPRPDKAHMDRLCTILAKQQEGFGAGQAGVEKLAGGAVAVITGQQPGLFTGPHLAILKALTAVKLARSLEQSGIRAVPIFWIAAEDHDHEEIATTWVLNQDSKLCRARVDMLDDVPSPVGWFQYKEDILSVVDNCISCLPQSDFAAEVRDILQSCYRPGKSPVESFGLMMARLFAGTPLMFVDPLHPELKKLAQPVMKDALHHNDEIRAAVLKRDNALAEAGYHQQVKVENSFTGLFAFRGRAREILKPADIAAAMSSEVALSPSALLRPVVQDSLFPTAAYIGGPAEVAYFAQSSAVYDVLGCPMPPIYPRIGATILEPRVHRSMKKYGIDFADVFQGREFLKRKCVAAENDVELFDRVRTQVEGSLESLRGPMEQLDATLRGSMETSKRKMLYQVESMRTRYINAAARCDETLERHLDGIGNSLYPEKKLQERVLNVTSFLARYGTGFIDRLDESLSLDSRQHQLVEI